MSSDSRLGGGGEHLRTTGPLEGRHRSPLKGAHNFRDMGGLPLTDGRQMRHRRLYRSDAMDQLTEDDLSLVRDYGIRFLVDLRDGGELASEGRGPLAHQPVCYVHTPLSRMDKAGDPKEILVQQYLDRLDSDPMLVEAVGMLAHATKSPTVVYCAAGKDRTGIVVALTLRILGVSEEAVVDDYMLTGRNMDAVNDRLRRSPIHRDMMATLPAEVYQVQEHTIRTFLEELDVRYRGARGWAEAKGLSKAVTALEEHLIE